MRKKHLLEVNGYDEDFIKAGVGEDVGIEWRLMSTRLNKKSMKNKAIVYHLHHPRSYSDAGIQEYFKMHEKKKKENQIICLNGIKKLNASN